MHGLPIMSLDDALGRLLKPGHRPGPEHLSWYQLTLEAHTVFYSKPPILGGSKGTPLLANPEAGQASWLSRLAPIRNLRVRGQPGGARHHLGTTGQLRRLPRIAPRAHGKLTTPMAEWKRYWRTGLPADYPTRPKDYCAGRKRKHSPPPDLALSTFLHERPCASGAARTHRRFLFWHATGQID